MGNIFDYLDWRGDLSFSTDPFRDVDNLVLSELAYVDFDGVVPESGVEITIREARDRYFELHTREEIRKRKGFTRLAPLLLDKLADSPRYAGLCLFDYLNIVDADRDEQISALTFRIGDGTFYAAFRGTDNTVVGWKEDFALSYRTTAGQQRSVQYLNEVFAGREGLIRAGGHSKGGNFAVYSSAFCMPGIRRRILQVYSNDGPGFREEVTERPEYQEVLPKVISIVPEESIIGILLSSEFDHRIVKSDASGFRQHDALTWQVMGGQFVMADGRTQVSLFFEKTIRQWLQNIDDATRESFTDSLFSLFETSGAETFREIRDGKLRSMNELFRSLRDLPPEKQAELYAVLIKLANSTVKSLTDSVRVKPEEKDRKEITDKAQIFKTDTDSGRADEGAGS